MPKYLSFAALLLFTLFFAPTVQALSIKCMGKSYSTNNPRVILAKAGTQRIKGTSSKDIILSFSDNNTIRALGGNDIICSGDGKDVIRGGAGDDRIDGGIGWGAIYGGAGNDQILVEGGNNQKSSLGQTDCSIASGGAGDDILRQAGTSDPDKLVNRLKLLGKDLINFVCFDGGAGDDISRGIGYFSDSKGINKFNIYRLGSVLQLEENPQGSQITFKGFETREELDAFKLKYPESGTGLDIISRAALDIRLGGWGIFWGRLSDYNDSVYQNTKSNMQILFVEAGSGNDTIIGSGQDDSFVGEWGQDTLIGRGGSDLFDGGTGQYPEVEDDKCYANSQSGPRRSEKDGEQYKNCEEKPTEF